MGLQRRAITHRATTTNPGALNEQQRRRVRDLLDELDHNHWMRQALVRDEHRIVGELDELLAVAV